MRTFRSGEALPAWSALAAFAILDLPGGAGQDVTMNTARERVLVTRGTVRVAAGARAIVLKENQFLDIELLGTRYALTGLSADAQAVRLSGDWGDELGGCGIFRVQTVVEPADGGDPVSYPKRTRVDSHYHDCDEFWILLEGCAQVVVGERQALMEPGDCVAIGMGHHHDMPDAPEPVKAVFFETTLEGEKRIGHLWNHTHGPAHPQPERI